MESAEHLRILACRALAELRKDRGLPQEQCAPIWGLKHKGSVSAIETGAERPSLEVALRIQVWSEGAIPAAELRPDLKDLIDTVLKTSPAGEGVAA